MQHLHPACALVPVLALLAVACGKNDAQARVTDASEPPPVKVTTVVVQQRPVPRFLAVTGTLKADRETEVAADANGKVVATFVERGSPVKQGAPLARLDVRSARLSEAQARAQARLAAENAELAKLECERGKALFEAGSIPKAEYDRRQSLCKTTESSVEIAHTGEQLARKVITDAIVRAPFAGVVGERYVNQGQYVRSETRIASIYVVDPLRLELTIPEAQLGAAAQGVPVEFRVAAFPDQLFTGTVQYVSPVVRRQSRDLVVEAVVKNPNGALKPGMFAEARLRVGEQQLPVVPSTALRRGEVAASVFAIVGGRASERVVQLGETLDSAVAVLAGVRPGDKLVNAPGEELHDGARVQE